MLANLQLLLMEIDTAPTPKERKEAFDRFEEAFTAERAAFTVLHKCFICKEISNEEDVQLYQCCSSCKRKLLTNAASCLKCRTRLTSTGRDNNEFKCFYCP